MSILISHDRLRDISDEHAYAQRMQRLNEELELCVRERTNKLEAAKEQAEAASRAKSTLLSNMSHEIRTRLNAVIGMTDLVLESPLEADQQKPLRSVSTSARALLGILNNILDVSKLESGKMEIEHIGFSIPKLLSDVGEMVAAHTSRGCYLHLVAIWLARPHRFWKVDVELRPSARLRAHGQLASKYGFDCTPTRKQSET